MRAVLSGLLVALLTAVVVRSAVGGGLGRALHSAKSVAPRNGHDAVYTTMNGQRWTISCRVSYAGGDLGDIIVDDYNVCIEACATMNFRQGSNVCVSVQFSALMAAHLSSGFGNCWSKNESAFLARHLAGDLSVELVT